MLLQSKIQNPKSKIKLISLAWSNVYALTKGRRLALIDTGLRQDRENLLAALQTLGFSENEVEAVFLTHGHCDHAGNAAFFAERGAKLYAHRMEAPFIGLPRRAYAPKGLHLFKQPLSALLFCVGEWRYPVTRRDPNVYFTDGDLLDAPGGALRVVASPGHSPGHSAFFRDSDRTLFSGDAIMNIIPVRRVSGLSLPLRVFSSDWAKAKRSARLLAELCPDTLLAGHGNPLRRETASRLLEWSASLALPEKR